MKRQTAVSLALCCLLLLGAMTACTAPGQTPEATSGVSSLPPGEKATVEKAADYAQVYQAIGEYRAKAGRGGGWGASTGGGEIQTDMAAPMEKAEAAASDGDMEAGSDVSLDYSGTNVQVEGVDEGDIVKTDGEYIYLLNKNDLVIVRAAGKETKILSRTELAAEDYDTGGGQERYPVELYLSGDRLAVIYRYYAYRLYPMPYVDAGMPSDDSRTVLKIYDISNKNAPVPLAELGQDGYYNASRMMDGVVYLLSDYSVYHEIDEDDPGTFVPAVYVDGEAFLIASDRIALWPTVSSATYTVIMSAALDSGAVLSSETILGGTDTVYMNDENLFLARTVYLNEEKQLPDAGAYTVVEHNNKNTTEISRYALSGGSVSLAASGKVDGYLINQFALDERGGYLRLVTTIDTSRYKTYTDEHFGWTNYEHLEEIRSNALYILDSGLSLAGSVEDLGQDERVYSVRFDGDIGYFVTFRETDPLFSVDLSNPESPKVLGALKIPGFSQYLHVYGEGELLGLGMDADEETGSTRGMKLSMFDVSDPANVTEKHKLLLEGSHSEALYNHKAILVAPGKDIIAFPAGSGYYIYGYDNQKGFYQRAYVEIAAEEYYWAEGARGLYIDEYAYICGESAISVLNLTDLTGELHLPL